MSNNVLYWPCTDSPPFLKCAWWMVMLNFSSNIFNFAISLSLFSTLLSWSVNKSGCSVNNCQQESATFSQKAAVLRPHKVLRLFAKMTTRDDQEMTTTTTTATMTATSTETSTGTSMTMSTATITATAMTMRYNFLGRALPPEIWIDIFSHLSQVNIFNSCFTALSWVTWQNIRKPIVDNDARRSFAACASRANISTALPLTPLSGI